MEFKHHFHEGVDHVSGPWIEAAVSRIGAEPIGLTWKRPGAAQVDILWRNGVVDPPADGWWRRHAPILFPIVGGIHGNTSRATTGEQVRFDGLHGFLRNRELSLSSHGPVDGGYCLSYDLVSDDATRAMYPWDFAVTVRYVFNSDGVEQSITVTNRGARTMPYQVGWHPGINVPLASGLKKNCHLRLPRGPVVRLLNDENCHLTGENVRFDSAGDFPFDEKSLELTYMFDVSGIKPSSRFVEILDPDEAVGVRVSFPDYPHIGIWSDAGAPFICVEPWQGTDDSVVQEPFDKKFGIVMLEPGRVETRRASIRVFHVQEGRR